MPAETYLELLQQLDALVRVFEEHPDETVQEQAVALLSAVDLLHREGLGRLADGLRRRGAGEALDELLAEDRVVHTLLGLYGFAELEVPAAAEEAARRPHGPGPAPTMTGAPAPRPAPTEGFVSISALRRGGGREEAAGESSPAADAARGGPGEALP